MSGSFFDSNFNMLGNQMAQAWQRTIETWWKGILGDQTKLRELAEELNKIRSQQGQATADAGVGDLSKMVEALELLERRQKDLEAQVAALAENLEAVVTFLEKSGGTPTKAPDEPAEPEDGQP